MHQGISPGNVERIVTKPVASATYESTFFAYAKNGQTVTHVVGEQWDDEGQTTCFPLQTHGYVNTFGWEYRYDGARARYAARGLDPARLYMVVNPLGGWSDYDGDEIYDDYYVNANSPPTTTRRFEPGIGRTDNTGSAYYHADHLGTIRGVTNSSASWTEPMAFTAFGERIAGSQNSTGARFGYVGSFGYQASGEFPFLHVGARYYDPATGRFLQRDPIGIRGGWNVYSYVRNTPSLRVDPWGLFDTKQCCGFCAGKYVECYTDDPRNPKHVTLCVANSNECLKNCDAKASEVLNDPKADPGPPPYPNPNDPEGWNPWPGVGTGCFGGGGSGASAGTLFTLFAVRICRRRHKREDG